MTTILGYNLNMWEIGSIVLLALVIGILTGWICREYSGA